MKPEIEVATTPDLVTRVHARLLRPHFPPSELSDCADIVEAVQAGRMEMLVARIDDDVVGTIVGERFGETMLIAWIATDPHHRSRAIGSALLSAGTIRWTSLPGIEIVLAEVERPDAHAVHPEYGDPGRRIAFYERAGTSALVLPYFQPSLGHGLPRVPHVLLALVGSTRPRPVPGTLSPAQARAVRTYLSEAIGPLQPGDVEHRRLLDAARSENGIRVIPIADYRSIPA